MGSADSSDERLWDGCSDQMAIEVESAYNEVVLSPDEWREFQLALEAPPRDIESLRLMAEREAMLGALEALDGKR